MKSSTFKDILLAFAVTGITTSAANAQSYAYSQPSPQYITNAGYGETGIMFTLNQDIMLTALGMNALQIADGDTPTVNLYQVPAGGVSTMTNDILSTYLIASTGSMATAIGPQNNVNGTNPGGAGSGIVAGGSPATATTYVTTNSSTLASLSVLLHAGSTYLITAPGYWIPTTNTLTLDPGNTGVFGSFSFMNVGGATNGGGGVPGGANAFIDTAYGAGKQVSNLVTVANSMTPGSSTLNAGAVAYIPISPNFQYSPVPEPAATILIGMGLLSVVMVTARRRSPHRD